MAIVILPVNYYFINWGTMIASIGTEWPELTQNNQGLLAVMGIKWWENHTALVIAQYFILVMGVGVINLLAWGVLLIVEFVSFISYLILSNKYDSLEQDECFLTMLSVDFYYGSNPSVGKLTVKNNWRQNIVFISGSNCDGSICC
jgi:hypothetical protein